MTFTLAELARVLRLRADGKAAAARAAFLRFETVPDTLLGWMRRDARGLDREAGQSTLSAVLLQSEYGKAWVCYRRADMRHVTKPGRLPVVPVLELRDLLAELQEG